MIIETLTTQRVVLSYKVSMLKIQIECQNVMGGNSIILEAILSYHLINVAGFCTQCNPGPPTTG